MKWLLTNRAWRDYQGAPAAVQKAFDKQVRFLAEDLRYPSLRTKKYDEANDIWQARVTRDLRFYFQMQGDTYTIIVHHSPPEIRDAFLNAGCSCLKIRYRTPRGLLAEPLASHQGIG